ISCGRIVTVSVSSITFKKPVTVGDVVCCYGDCIKIGRTSMTINLEVWVKPVKEDGIGERFQVCEATFNYVAIDANGRPREISLHGGSQKSC
ncbi:MAG: hotdog domain-containing protein, partial [Vibrio sp.]